MAEAGYTFIGTFEEGCIVTATKQVILLKATGDCYEWTGTIGAGYVVEAGADPTLNDRYISRTNAVGGGVGVMADGTALDTSMLSNSELGFYMSGSSIYMAYKLANGT